MASQRKSNYFIICFFLLSFAAIIPKFVADDDDTADVAEDDSYWKLREEKALNLSSHAYHPHPELVNNKLNYQVDKFLKGDNSTRRNLSGKHQGPCNATNPIDACWRCDPNWADDRFKLVKCNLGFGQNTTGGLGGQIYVVTSNHDDPKDPKPGTLRYGVIQKEPLWIVFERGMSIKLAQELIVNSNKTIDGRGVDPVDISHGAGISIFHVHNVIIHNIKIHDIKSTNGGMIRDSVDHIGLRTKADGDGISIFGSSNVWIDHVSLSHCQDGLIDAIAGSTAITISNCHFTRQKEGLLFGSSDTFKQDKKMQITVAFNHFGHEMYRRMPRCRLGFFHLVNNDYAHYVKYVIGGSANPTIISQGNRFVAPQDPYSKQVTIRVAPESEWKNWQWRSEGDLFLNGAFFVQSGNPDYARKVGKDELVPACPGAEAPKLTKYSGYLSCKVGHPC